jgi:hypothetical protein
MKSKKSLYKKGSFMEDSKEMEFGGPSKKYSMAGPAPTMSTKEALGKVFQGKMTATQAHTAIGKTTKPAMNSTQKAEFLTKLKTSKKTGGGRFAKMVKGLKKEGKSEDSAKAIAASIGRKKYGKSKFQAMAAAGKSKKQTGGPDEETGRAGKVQARAEKVMGKAKASWTKAEATKSFDKTKEARNFAQDEFGMNAARKANQLYNRAERQEKRAERLMEKSQYLKASKPSKQKMGGKKKC